MDKSVQEKAWNQNAMPFVPYPQPGHAFDEVYDAARKVRPHWQAFLQALTQLGAEGIQDRQTRALRILRDDGATYDLKNDPLSPAVWSLDVIPQLIDCGEWQRIEQGLAQRAELFNLILKDLYGEQRLIKSGVLPPEVVFSHPGFLRQCFATLHQYEQPLVLHAVDMVRDVTGQMVVIADRTQAPSGAGYALENRTVISRVLPDMFRRHQVKPLSGFFLTLRNTLKRMASHLSDAPRVVVLTPGADSSTYFEQVYLANHLGYPLVQGGDLTVRNGKVWLKSLYGLTPVDVILRRTDDVDCDQTELRADSAYGIPGLLEVARAGNVVLANPLGSGVLEAPILLTFLPQICQFLLGNNLLLPNVATWWCGRETDRQYVVANLDRLILKSAYRSNLSQSVYGHTLTAEQKAHTIAMIERDPQLFVAESYIPGALCPVWHQRQWQARPGLMRTFMVADQGRYTVMPGGLVRIAESDQDYIVSKLSGSLSKDTWVLSDKPDTDYQSLLGSPAPSVAEQANLPSRVIDNLFWFGRYAERAEMSLRLMRTLFKQFNGFEPLPEESRTLLLTAISRQTGCLPGFTVNDQALWENPEHELAEIVTNGQRPGSIKASLHAMLSCGEQVKEMLSSDTRIILNQLRDHLADVEVVYQQGLPSVPEESLDSLVTSLLALSGLNHESMLRGMDWTFQQIGRRTERAMQTATLIEATLTPVLPQWQQQQILESALLTVEALISFRRRYQTRTRVANGLDLLICDATNPRSLVYQFECLLEYIKPLPHSETTLRGHLSEESRLLIKALNEVQLVDLERLSQPDFALQSRPQLQALMQQIIQLMQQFTQLISDKYFDHTTRPQPLIKPKWKRA